MKHSLQRRENFKTRIAKLHSLHSSIYLKLSQLSTFDFEGDTEEKTSCKLSRTYPIKSNLTRVIKTNILVYLFYDQRGRERAKISWDFYAAKSFSFVIRKLCMPHNLSTIKRKFLCDDVISLTQPLRFSLCSITQLCTHLYNLFLFTNYLLVL